MLRKLVMAAPFGERLKELRSAKFWTQEKLSQESGVTVGTIRHLEQKDADPKFSTLCALARALGVKLDAFSDLCPDDDKPKNKKM